MSARPPPARLTVTTHASPSDDPPHPRRLIPRRLPAYLAALSVVLLAACAAPPPSAHLAASRTRPAIARPARTFGDFNGDGLADIVVRGPADPRVAGQTHTAAVVFGARTSRNVSLRALTAGTGLLLRAAGPLADARAAGDLDGDGLGDILISTTERTSVVFGRRRPPATIDLAAATSVVVRLAGAACAVAAGVGDVNADGRDDLACTATGPLRVILGRRDRAALARPPRRGFTVDLGRWQAGVNIIAPAGDANGDGVGDFAVALEDYRPCITCDFGSGGRVFVILGRRHPAPVSIRGTFTTGFRVPAAGRRRPAGFFVDAVAGYATGLGSAGDIDGDGLSDLLVPGWEEGQGTVVVYGDPAARPVRANPPSAPDVAGVLLAADGLAGGPIGDVTGDGLADVLITDRDDGSLRVLRGRRGRPATFDPQPGDWHIAQDHDRSAQWAGPIGDVNGDGLGDLAVAASGVQYADEPEVPPTTYVLLGTRGPGPQRLTGPPRRVVRIR